MAAGSDSDFIATGPGLAINLRYVVWFVPGETTDDPVTLYMAAPGPDGSNRIVVDRFTADKVRERLGFVGPPYAAEGD